MPDKPSHFTLIEIKSWLSPLLFLVLVINIIFFLNYMFLFGMLSLGLTLAVLYMANGYVIEKETMRIRKITRIMGFTFGKWYTLPDVKFISVLRVRMSRKVYQPSAAMFTPKFSGGHSYRVSMVFKTPGKPYRLISTTREKALDHGLALGNYLDVPVVDSTTPNQNRIR